MSKYQYSIHPLIKLMILISFNIVAFLHSFDRLRYYILLLEIVLLILTKVKRHYFIGLIKFLIYSFIPIYSLFYLVDFSWYLALLSFLDYFLTTTIMFLAIFVFYSATPPYELLHGLRSIFIPKSLALGLTAAISFFPLITDSIKITKITQESRGYKFKLWKMGPILIPTILFLMNKSLNLALSLESRGYEL